MRGNGSPHREVKLAQTLTSDQLNEFRTAFRTSYTTKELLRLYRDIDKMDDTPKAMIDQVKDVVYDILRNERGVELVTLSSLFVLGD